MIHRIADSLSGRAQLANKLVALDESRLLLAYGCELLVAFLAEEFVLLRQGRGNGLAVEDACAAHGARTRGTHFRGGAPIVRVRAEVYVDEERAELDN